MEDRSCNGPSDRGKWDHFLASVLSDWSGFLSTHDLQFHLSLSAGLKSLLTSAEAEGARQVADLARYAAVLLNRIGGISIPQKQQVAEISEALARLESAVTSGIQTEPENQNRQAGTKPLSRILLLLPEADPTEFHHLEARLGRHGFSVQICKSIGELPGILSDFIPDVMVVRLDGMKEHELGIITAFAHTTSGKVPVLGAARTDDFQARLRASRAGCSGFIPVPIMADELEARINEHLSEIDIHDITVMIVDDDEQVTAAFAEVFTAFGLKMLVQNEPLQVFSTLSTKCPDIFLVDLYMPSCTGRELTRLLRQDDRFSTRPILYLSSETDPVRQLDALDAGADGFLVKGSPMDQMVSVVRHQVSRWRRRERAQRLALQRLELEKDSVALEVRHLEGELTSLHEVIHQGCLGPGCRLYCSGGGCFEIIGPLSRGHTNTTYMARDAEGSGLVVLKMLRPDIMHDEKTMQRFLAEARLVMNLQHPCLVRGRGYHRGRNYAFIVMDFVDGVSVRDRIRKDGCLKDLEVVELAIEVTRALVYMEERGLVHRDIKPDNIILGSGGNVILVDFGLAVNLHTEEESAGEISEIFATPHYASPEQIRGGAIDTRSDIYSLGATMYHMVAGAPPHMAANLNDILELREHSCADPAAAKPDMHIALAGLIRTMTQPDPDHRPAHAKPLLNELIRLEEEMQEEGLDADDTAVIMRTHR